MQLTLAQLESLLRTLEAGGAGEFEYQDDKYRVRIALARGGSAHGAPARSSPMAAPAPVAAVAVQPATLGSDEVAVTSPFVGTFYRAPSPDAQDFVEVGSTVKQGQPLCIIEAMKLMNEIESDVAGTVVEVLVENGKSVEYGQKLFLIKKSG
jgi:acetyl-CoA carboxylase biotin carboxyl carrier protein